VGIWEIEQEAPDLPRPLRLFWRQRGVQDGDGDLKTCKNPHGAVGRPCQCILAVLCAQPIARGWLIANESYH